MKKQHPRKLPLRKETIRAVQPAKLGEVAGGDLSPTARESVCNCELVGGV